MKVLLVKDVYKLGRAGEIKKVTLSFPAKAGDTGKLYGSITTQDIATALSEQVRFEVKRQQVDIQPIRTLGEFTAHVRLTMDLVPEIKIIVHREGESAESVKDLVLPAEPEAKPKKGGRKPREGKAKPVEEKAETE